MKIITQLSLTPQEAATTATHKDLISEKINIELENITCIRLVKRTIDARQKQILFHLTYEVFIDEVPYVIEKIKFNNDVSNKQCVIIVGAGPAGLFAALRLIELGIKPVIIERGKKVEDRKHDVSAINRKRIVDEDSNYCFGEGGAGAYSDGKLYTRSTKRGDVNRILRILKQHGATEDILVDAHPHIGTDKLPGIIANIRNTIINCGGEFHFNQRVNDVIIKNGEAKGVITKEGMEFAGEAVILATGHSAKDIYELLFKKNILVQSKPFAAGIRVEHPQQLIDSIQYHSKIKNEFLPSAAYSLSCNIDGRGVYSFCMCPGGNIINSSTSNEELVLNGMSNSQRNSAFANAGIVVTVDEKDYSDYEKSGALAGLKFREAIEKSAFIAGSDDFTAPAQCMMDFVQNKISSHLNDTSYYSEIKSYPLHELLPSFITKGLQQAFIIFGEKMKWFLSNEATLLGVETRTSSPVRIPRDNNTLEHLQINNLYPCGEGAGYSGGIVSSAIDGVRCADAIVKKINI